MDKCSILKSRAGMQHSLQESVSWSVHFKCYSIFRTVRKLKSHILWRKIRICCGGREIGRFEIKICTDGEICRILEPIWLGQGAGGKLWKVRLRATIYPIEHKTGQGEWDVETFMIKEKQTEVGWPIFDLIRPQKSLQFIRFLTSYVECWVICIIW